ncbi:MAG: DNA-3-methyladenine glycosylase I [Spirochaetaceae bacterium]|nr:DNA-3-methyladenine glycosylase I [Spirochaetaceae bacterium]
MELIRCPWCLGKEEYMRYHDEEWGVPVRDSVKLFEELVLDGMQAGLSWVTILRRRDDYRKAFDNMDPEIIANYGEIDVERIMGTERIIRNRQKIEAAIKNARAYLAMRDQGHDFSAWLWDWVDGKPIVNHYNTMKEIPSSTPLSTRISKILVKRGFSFVGPTIVYAFMQASGFVNDHLVSCFRHDII